jgi:anti-sigma factor RsiW
MRTLFTTPGSRRYDVTSAARRRLSVVPMPLLAITGYATLITRFLASIGEGAASSMYESTVISPILSLGRQPVLLQLYSPFPALTTP